MPGFDGLIYLFTVPAGLVVGLLVDVGIAMTVGPTWWLLLPPVAGFWIGMHVGAWLERG